MATKSNTIEIDALKQGRLTARIVGTTPLYFHAMSAKTKRTLLMGGGRKTAAEKKNSTKHDPHEEFRTSMYRLPAGPTLLGFPAPGVKAAMATAALETPGGLTKASVNRLIFLPEQKIKVYGTPYLKMDVVRSLDMNKTPDIRTRAFLPRWCAEVDIAYVEPTLNAHSILSLLANAGTVVGIGDFRQEKGRGSFGTFSIVNEGDELWDEIAEEGRAAQQAAFDHPEMADPETEELMEIYEEVMAQKLAVVA